MISQEIESQFQNETSVFTPTLKIVDLCVANSQCITMFQQYISLYLLILLSLTEIKPQIKKVHVYIFNYSLSMTQKMMTNSGFLMNDN